MKIFIQLKGGSSFIENGEVIQKNEGELLTYLNSPGGQFITLDHPTLGKIIVNRDAIAYIRKAQ